jgi:F0F1-type ATP synthase membrane subunit c/vacuolar-type H+-ATPase subunit K
MCWLHFQRTWQDEDKGLRKEEISMKKTVSLILLALSLVVLLAPVVFAEEAASAAAAGDAKLRYYAVAALACGIAIGVAAFGASIGQGMGLKGATEGIARNPGAPERSQRRSLSVLP